jgi:hypothetical protein
VNPYHQLFRDSAKGCLYTGDKDADGEPIDVMFSREIYEENKKNIDTAAQTFGYTKTGDYHFSKP